MIRMYKNIDLLYQEDTRRKTSGEVDYGVWWKSIYNKDPHRISWIKNTGEFYIKNLITNEVQLANTIAKTREEAEAVMENWAEKISRGYIQNIFPEIVI